MKNILNSKDRGITLIALVITIIVMLILAGVTLSIAINGGLFKQAQSAAALTNQAAQNEQEAINNVLDEMGNYVNGTGGGATNNTTGDNTTGNNTPPTVPDWSDPYTSTAKDNYTDKNGGKATVPAGFSVSQKDGENTIAGGLVIKDSVGNEFVWIPVANPSDMIDTTNNRGKLYDFGTNTSPKNPPTVIAYSATGYREPDILTDTTNGDTDANLSGIGLTQSTFKTQIQTDFNNMAASVTKYYGFYVGRYETGNLSKGTVVSQKGNTDIGSQTWYTMYVKERALYSNSTDSVQSGMICGCQWDQMLKVIYASDNTKNLTDSSSWGNYINATFNYTDVNGTTQTKTINSLPRIPTGSTEYTKAYNIYDAAGNVNAWTQEADSTNCRVLRGGYYGRNGAGYPASAYYYYYPTYSHDGLGSRLQLYIK